jgi:tRNA G10  N-methylase Trm11
MADARRDTETYLELSRQMLTETIERANGLLADIDKNKTLSPSLALHMVNAASVVPGYAMALLVLEPFIEPEAPETPGE